MQIQFSVPIIEHLGPGMFRAELRSSELNLFGKPSSKGGIRSIVILKDHTIEDDGKILVFQSQNASLANRSSDSECVFVSVNVDLSEVSASMTPTMVSGALNGSHSTSSAPIKVGDKAFLDSCREEDLPEEITLLAKEFLSSIRKFSNDELHEGKNRKWVTKPHNFLAMTIQTRNKQFCLQVKKSPILSKLLSVLDIRDDRPGYARFWLQNEKQLQAAVAAARASSKVQINHLKYIEFDRLTPDTDQEALVSTMGAQETLSNLEMIRELFLLEGADNMPKEVEQFGIELARHFRQLRQSVN